MDPEPDPDAAVAAYAAVESDKVTLHEKQLTNDPFRHEVASADGLAHAKQE